MESYLGFAILCFGVGSLVVSGLTGWCTTVLSRTGGRAQLKYRAKLRLGIILGYALTAVCFAIITPTFYDELTQGFANNGFAFLWYIVTMAAAPWLLFGMFYLARVRHSMFIDAKCDDLNTQRWRELRRAVGR
jgi:hypothetical protein